MGVTSESVKIINKALSHNLIFHNHNLDRKLSIVDLGAQNNYTDEVVRTAPSRYPYFSEWWKQLGFDYFSIDLSGENDCEKWDLSKPLPTRMQFDFVCDFGTSEHVDDIYQCFANIDSLCRINGLMIHENPKTGNWPQHCFHYYTQGFYIDLAAKAGYEILEIGETVAMGNHETGNNVFCIMRKKKEIFITRDLFPETQKK